MVVPTVLATNARSSILRRCDSSANDKPSGSGIGTTSHYRLAEFRFCHRPARAPRSQAVQSKCSMNVTCRGELETLAEGNHALALFEAERPVGGVADQVIQQRVAAQLVEAAGARPVLHCRDERPADASP